MVPAISVANLTQYLMRNEWRAAPKVVKIIRDQYTICLSIVLYVMWLWRAILLAVVRVLLHPPIRIFGMMVDVVANNRLTASVPNGTLTPVLRRFPVLIEAERVGYGHGINAATDGIEIGTSYSDDPVASLSCRTYPWLTRCQCANAVERIGRKSEVSCDYVDVYMCRHVSTWNDGKCMMARGVRRPAARTGYPCRLLLQ